MPARPEDPGPNVPEVGRGRPIGAPRRHAPIATRSRTRPFSTAALPLLGTKRAFSRLGRGDDAARPVVRVSDGSPVAGVYGRRGAHARPGDRREYGDLQPHRRDLPPRAAVRPAG